MGTSSAQLFDDDVAADIQAYYEESIAAGKKPAQIALDIVADNVDYFEDDDSVISFLALATLLHDSGLTTHPAIDMALKIIDAGEGLERWEEAGDDALAERKRE